MIEVAQIEETQRELSRLLAEAHAAQERLSAAGYAEMRAARELKRAEEEVRWTQQSVNRFLGIET